MCLASLYPLLQPYWPMVCVMPVDYTHIIGIGKTWWFYGGSVVGKVESNGFHICITV